MKTKLTILLVVLCNAFATTAVFGQTTFTWTNQFPANTISPGDLGTSANWSPNGIPIPTTGPDGNGVYGDEMRWDGRTTGDLSVTANQNQTGFSGSAWGLRVHLTTNQTGAVNIHTLVNGVSSGTRMQSFTIDSGAGSFSLGDFGTTNLFDMVMGGVAGQVHNFINNSTNPAIIYPNARWRLGGGGVHNFVFDGTGNWTVSNVLIAVAGSPIVVTKSGTGTMTWFSTNLPQNGINSVIQGPMTINGGTLILQSSGCFPTVIQTVVHNGVLLKFDAASQSDTFAGAISGTGPLQVNNGTLLLSGQSTFTGNILLSGGKLVAGSAETVGISGPLGAGGTISFTGGTLGFSANNSFDYSPRFSTAAGQAYNIDTAGQSVRFSNNLGSSGGTLTKTNNGTLTLAGTSSYSGLTTVSGGTLTFESAKTGSGNLTVADGATLGVFDNGTQVTPATLTLGSSAGANLEFNNVTSTTTALLAAGTLSSAGTNTININSGTFTVGQSYPLLAWTSGSAPAISLGIVNGAGGTLSTNGNKIQFNVTSVAPVWTGANSGNWSNPNNWTTPYSDFRPVQFDDTASGTTSVMVDVPVYPASVIVNNSTKTYSITSSGGNNIAGVTGLTKSDSGTLTLSGGANTYTGVTTLKGGTVIVGTLASGSLASDIGAASNSAGNLVLNGGTLQYTGGPASIDRLFTVGLSGGTIDASGSGALTLNNLGTVGLSGTLRLTGNNVDTNTLAAALINSGSLNKSGTCTWVLTGTNAYGGGTTISAGVLQVGAGGASGALGSGNVLNNASLVFNRLGTLTVSGVISGNGSVINNGSGTVILPGNNTYSGGTTISAGTLQVGNGGATGSLNGISPIVNNGTLSFNTTGMFNYTGNGLISGTGNVIVQGGGRIKTIGANTYTGWTRIDAGSIFQPCEGNTGGLVSSVVTNNGTLLFVRQDTGVFIYRGPIHGSGRVRMGLNNFNPGDVTLLGTNTYTGGTFIGGGAIILGDGVTPVAGQIVGNVTFTNNLDTPDDQSRILTFFRPDDFTFSGNIVTNFSSPQNNRGIVQQNGSGTLTLTGSNNYGGGTIINAGTVQVGTGGTGGSIGTGPVTDNGILIFNRSDAVTFGGVISGGGSLEQRGSGVLTLTASNTYSGTTTVSNGTLVVNGDNLAASTYVYAGTLGGTGTFYGPVTLEAETTLAPAASVGTMTIHDDLSIGGNIAIEVNKSLSPSNDVVVVTGVLTNTGTGTLTVANLGPALAVGDKFTLFSQSVSNGAALTVTGAGANWANNLAVDGSITVSPPALNFTRTGNSLQFSWTGSFKLQAQTNSINVGLSSNWDDYPGGGTSGVTVPIDVTKGTAFFRLVSTP